jgi:hypothetical protein
MKMLKEEEAGLEVVGQGWSAWLELVLKSRPGVSGELRWMSEAQDGL